MEKKLIGLVFIALIGGLGGGYGLGYVIYQPQILGLQSDVSNLQSELSSLNADYSTLQNQLTNSETQINRLNTSYHDLNSKYSLLNSSYTELMNTILLYESPIEITSVNATSWSLNYTVRNNGERMEYLIPSLIYRDINGNRIGQSSSSLYSKMIFPQEEVTINTNTFGFESFIIEVWTYDGDKASAYVEV